MNVRREYVVAASGVPVCFVVFPTDRAIVASALVCAIALRWVPRVGTLGAEVHKESEAQALPLVCDILALALEAGLSWERSVWLASNGCPPGVQHGLRIAAGRLAMGAAPSEVWRGMAALDSVGEVVERSLRTGGAVSELLTQHAASLRARQRTVRIMRVRRLETTILMPITFLGLPAGLLLGTVPVIASLVMDSGLLGFSTGR